MNSTFYVTQSEKSLDQFIVDPIWKTNPNSILKLPKASDVGQPLNLNYKELSTTNISGAYAFDVKDTIKKVNLTIMDGKSDLGRRTLIPIWAFKVLKGSEGNLGFMNPDDISFSKRPDVKVA